MHEAEQAIAGLGGALSGRVGSVVFSHNRHGPYSYTWSSRTDPNTSFQQQIRTWFGTAATVWKNFTPAHRESWDTYAQNLGRRSRVGQERHPTGYNVYVGTYTFSTLMYIPMVPTAPTVFTRGRLGLPTYAPSGIFFIQVTFDPSDEWLHHSTGGFALFQSPRQPMTVNTYHERYRLVGVVRGPITGPPYVRTFPPIWMPWPQPCRIFLRARAIEPDGRLSPSVYAPLDFP